jgi:methionyl-tRNA synthetase
MKPMIQYPDFEKLEIRVGTVMAAVAPEWSEKLLKFTVFFGSEIGEKTVFSGVSQYPPEHLLANFLFIINLAEEKWVERQPGMMLTSKLENPD